MFWVLGAIEEIVSSSEYPNYYHASMKCDSVHAIYMKLLAFQEPQPVLDKQMISNKFALIFVKFLS